VQILGIISSLNPEGPNNHYITAKPAFIAKFERYFIRPFLEEIGTAIVYFKNQSNQKKYLLYFPVYDTFHNWLYLEEASLFTQESANLISV